MKVILFTFVVFLFAQGCFSLTPKKLAGPPSEFSSYVIPSPIYSAMTESSYSCVVNLVDNSDGVSTWTQQLPVDSNIAFGFSVFSPSASSPLQILLLDPDGNSVNLTPFNATQDYFPIGDYEVPALTYVIQNPVVGFYTITLSIPTLKSAKKNEIPGDGYLVWWNDSPVSTFSYLQSYNLISGQEIGVVASLYDESETPIDSLPKGTQPNALHHYKATAELIMIEPNGDFLTTPMHDDGLHNDGASDDGVFGGSIKIDGSGEFVAKAQIKAIDTDSKTPIFRSSQHLIPIVVPQLALSGSAKINPPSELDSTTFTVEIGVTPLGDKSSTTLHRAYSEVWGTDTNGKEVAVCWIAGIVESKDNVVELEIDASWISQSGAQAPFTLKNVVLQEVETEVPVSQVSSIVTQSEGVDSFIFKLLSMGAVSKSGPITDVMREGHPPAGFKMAKAGEGALLLVHGFCSQFNPWQKFASGDFTNAYYFDNPKASLSNDAFAKKVADWAESLGLEAYSIVAHSQGGLVGLHLKNFYWSGLDKVSGTGVLLQSVGSPYYGNTGAGTASDLIKIFGVGCGANTDLTVDGARLWMSGISMNSRSFVNYYTTSYPKKFLNYCNMVTNWILTNLNDGIAEEKYSSLDGANNQGNKDSWCHSADMKYPPQTSDHTRNAIMNANAAR